MCECEWNGLRILRGSIKASVFDRAGEVREKTLKNSAEELALNERGIVGWAFSFPTSLTRSQYAMTPKHGVRFYSAQRTPSLRVHYASSI
jgi:hypothetical protein